MAKKLEKDTFYYTDNIRLKYDYRDFGGPNMWHMEIKRPDGFWDRVQWMSRGNAMRRTDVELPRFEE